MHKLIRGDRGAVPSYKPTQSPTSLTSAGLKQLLTWGVLGGCKRGHGIGKVKVSSDAELALHCWGVRRGGSQQRFFAGLLVDSRQVSVNQGIKELHYQLSIVWDLCLLWARGEKKKRLVLSFLLCCQFELCPRSHSNVALLLPQNVQSICCIYKN